jgi:hypothetical protein
VELHQTLDLPEVGEHYYDQQKPTMNTHTILLSCLIGTLGAASLRGTVGTTDASTNEAMSTLTVYVIRHGEKTGPDGCLNVTGTARAARLPTIFNSHNQSNSFITPSSFFAMNYDDNGLNCQTTT